MSTSTTMQHPEQTFTLIFPRGEIAVLQVIGVMSQQEGRAIAASVLPDCTYEVKEGDISGGHAFCFYSWASAQAQEQDPRQPGRRIAQAQEQREEVHV
ncbi:hypothetical protein KDA_76990 [Dictyobacter alpinus]|uniref:Uncharacterized protein n=1 Tax=Dictyobacter alpinus TaxID=2014873 RepID=A0A402BLG3_9CHLR|nr:hypothetical protein [Dictyobacter alpinus]GCE32215.1 hypothetical protein KDA_76990 [Dictyobacter alpinus]